MRFLLPMLLCLAVPPCAVAAQNLLLNPDVEDGVEAPAHWSFSTAWPDKFTGDWGRDAASGKRSLHIVSRTNGMSAYWGQSVTLKPNTNYVLKARTKIVSGRALIYVHNKELNARAYYATAVPSPLAPVFVKPEWVKDARVDSQFASPGQWFTAQLRFHSGAGGDARVSLGSYFLTGEMCFDDIRLEETAD